MFVHCGWVFFTNCSPSCLDTTKVYSRASVSYANYFLMQTLFYVTLITEGRIEEFLHLCWDWVGTMVDRELGDNNYSEEVRGGWKEARCNGLRSVEVDLLRMIDGRG
jgi:hypothetical protein